MLNQKSKTKFLSTFCSGTVINYGSGSDFLTSYGSTSQKVTVPTVPVPQHFPAECFLFLFLRSFFSVMAKCEQNTC
jgi:hypothetical protein